MREVFSPNRCHLGRRVRVYQRLESTNSHALALAHDPTQNGLVVLADEQTAGRGQYGRTWQAPAGSSVLMSVLLFPPPALRRPVLLTAWAAVAVSTAIDELTGLRTTIKWPNDVFLDSKKVCGILIEQRNSGHPEHPLATVVGIGVNVTQPIALFQQAGLMLAGSLASQSGKDLATADVTAAVIRHLDDAYDPLLRGDFAMLETGWKERLGLVGKWVRVEGLQQYYRGRLHDVTLAMVTLETPAGAVSLAPEAIRHIAGDGDGPPGSTNRG